MEDIQDAIEYTIAEIRVKTNLLTRVVEQDPLYPKEDVDLILQQIKKLHTDLQGLRDAFKTGLEPGNWIQVYASPEIKPIYGKVLSDHPENPAYLYLEGLYDTGLNGELVKRVFKKTRCIKVPYEVGRHLEFANKLNIYKQEKHTRGIL